MKKTQEIEKGMENMGGIFFNFFKKNKGRSSAAQLKRK
jgi:hypothetical protein